MIPTLPTHESSCPICGLALSSIQDAVYHCIDSHNYPYPAPTNFEFRPFGPQVSLFSPLLPTKSPKNPRKIPDKLRDFTLPKNLVSCPFCDKSPQIDLPRHILFDHPEKLDEKIEISCSCKKRVNLSAASLKAHLSDELHCRFIETAARNLDVYPRKCGICKEQFLGLIDHIEHMKIHHPVDNKNKPRRVLCLCGARIKVAGPKNTFIHLVSEQHLNFCYGDFGAQKEISCPICKKNFGELLPAFLHFRDEHDHKSFKESLSCPCGSKIQLNASINFVLEHEKGAKHCEFFDRTDENRLKPLEPF